MAVPKCQPVRNAVSQQCAGPPDTLPDNHGEAPDPFGHLARCSGCFASMVQCWRGGCEPAGDAVGDVVHMFVDARVRGLSRGIAPRQREDARQNVVVNLLHRIRRTDGWNAEKVVGLANLAAFTSRAITNEYFTWYNRHVVTPEVPATHDDLRELGDTRPRLVASASAVDTARSSSAQVDPDTIPGSDLSDPVATQVSDRLQTTVVAPDTEEQVGEALTWIRDTLARSRHPEDAKLYAQWLRYCVRSSAGGRGPSRRQFAQDHGLPHVTTWRRLARVEELLHEAISSDASVDGPARDYTLIFLSRVATLADSSEGTDHD